MDTEARSLGMLDLDTAPKPGQTSIMPIPRLALEAPPHEACGHARDDRVRWDIAGDDRPRPDDRAVTDPYALKHCDTRSNPHIAPNHDVLVDPTCVSVAVKRSGEIESVIPAHHAQLGTDHGVITDCQCDTWYGNKAAGPDKDVIPQGQVGYSAERGGDRIEARPLPTASHLTPQELSRQRTQGPDPEPAPLGERARFSTGCRHRTHLFHPAAILT